MKPCNQKKLKTPKHFPFKHPTGFPVCIAANKINSEIIFMTAKKSFIDKLKTRWGITSTWQVIIILLVFALTGTSVLYAEKLVQDLLNIPPNLEWYYTTLLFIVITLPIYNILLLVYGFVFGQFRFFWNFEKKFFGRIGALFQRRAARE